MAGRSARWWIILGHPVDLFRGHSLHDGTIKAKLPLPELLELWINLDLFLKGTLRTLDKIKGGKLQVTYFKWFLSKITFQAKLSRLI